MNKSVIRAVKLFHISLKSKRLETGFSMLEAVVVVGVLLALAIGGFVAYGTIAENAKMAKVKTAASEIHTGILAATFDGDASTDTQKVLDNWNGSTDAITVEVISGPGSNGDFCVQAKNRKEPNILARTGACASTSDPNPDSGNGGSNPPVNSGSDKCLSLSVSEEVSCWNTILLQAETDYETVNGHYFGAAKNSSQIEYAFNPTEMLGAPLKWGTAQEVYRDSEDPTWDYNSVRTILIDRDGNFWQGGFYHEITSGYSESDTLGIQQVINYATNTSTPINVSTACDFVTPSMLYSGCSIAGIAPDKYLVTASNSDSVAHADIKKVIQKQYEYLRDNKAFYGESQILDASTWAGTTYPTKIWTKDNGWDGYMRIIVTTPNGDLYTENVSFRPAYPAMPVEEYRETFRYTSEMVTRVCTTPFQGLYNQQSDIPTCSALGFPNFHG